MKYEVNLIATPGEPEKPVVWPPIELNKDSFESLLSWLKKVGAWNPVGVPEPETVSETPAPVFESPTVTEMPAETPETAQESQNEG